MTILKAEDSYLIKDVDYVKSTNFISLFESTEDLDAPANFEIPPTTTNDMRTDYVAFNESEAKTDEEYLDA